MESVAAKGSITPYIFFNGNCREAVGFYKKVLGGEIMLVTYGEMQGNACPEGAKDRIIHAALKRGNYVVLMASDTPDNAPTVGDNVHLALDCESLPDIESKFKALGEGGEVDVALHDAPFGARFGMLTDRYGFHWMLSFDLRKK